MMKKMNARIAVFLAVLFMLSYLCAGCASSRNGSTIETSAPSETGSADTGSSEVESAETDNAGAGSTDASSTETDPAETDNTEAGSADASSTEADSAETDSADIPNDYIDFSPEMIPLADSPPMPTASGTDVRKNDKAEIDVSNAKDGYFMIKYLAKTTKTIKVLVKTPKGTQYQYSLKTNGSYEVYPFSDGNGEYQIGVYENVSGSSYATAHTTSINVKLSDEFAPFIRPNQYVNYTKDSSTVKKAAEITKSSKTTIDKIAVVYNYVVKNITYDVEFASNVKNGSVKSGYLPNVDTVLSKGKGICFDYASVMAAMLRSQGIPTKLVVGYANGNIYHAWLSVYTKETGWIDNVISFDGKSWKLMDPTFASSGSQSAEVMKFIGNGSNYAAKYTY